MIFRRIPVLGVHGEFVGAVTRDYEVSYPNRFYQPSSAELFKLHGVAGVFLFSQMFHQQRETQGVLDLNGVAGSYRLDVMRRCVYFYEIYSLSNSAQINTIKSYTIFTFGNKLTD